MGCSEDMGLCKSPRGRILAGIFRNFPEIFRKFSENFPKIVNSSPTTAARSADRPGEAAYTHVEGARLIIYTI